MTTERASNSDIEEPDPLAVAMLWDRYYITTHFLRLNGVGTGRATSRAVVKTPVLEADAYWIADTEAGGRDEPDPVALGILWDSYVVDTYLDSVDGVASQFADTRAEVKARVLSSVAWLLRRSLVELYSVDTSRPPGEEKIPWHGTVEELVDRLDRVYTNDLEDWRVWGYSCWFSNTEAGDALAEQYPPEPWDDDDD